MNRFANAPRIEQRTGHEKKAKTWIAEAAARMLMNNLHPDVAERPEDLVVYGGIGRAARDWASYDAIHAALERLEAHPGSVDLVLSDVVMPGMGGAELVRRLRELSPPPQMLFMTGYADEGGGALGQLEPEVELLKKPFAMGDLLGRVREVLDRGGPGGRAGATPE